MAVLKVGNFTCKIILAPFVLANSLVSEKMLNQAHLLVLDFENLGATWALIVTNVAFLSALDVSTAGFSNNWFTPVQLSEAFYWSPAYHIRDNWHHVYLCRPLLATH